MADTTTTKFHYRYPLTKLEKSDDYLKITVIEYKAPGFDAPAGTFQLPTAGDPNAKLVEKGTIILPIPDDINDKNGVTWGNSTLNPLQAGIGNAGADAYKDITKVPNQIMSIINDIVNASQVGTAQKFGAGTAIGYAANLLFGQGEGGNAGFVSRFSGAITNSNIELVFSSVNIRDPFLFSFDIVPRSQKEAMMVKEIIRAFKKYSAAKKSVGKATGLFLKAPEVFKLEYMNGGSQHPYLNKFKICALQSMSVNYTPTGSYATYADGAPVNMILGLSFQELTPIYHEDYDEGIGKDGMGF